MRRRGSVTTDILLVGGGHAHVQVMTRLAMEPVPGLRLTLVTDRLETPYSGMLPGAIAGLYSRDEIHIDLARLAFATGARLVHARATGLDRAARRVLLEDRPPLAYDWLSLDVGIVPDLTDIDDPQGFAVPVKPIADLLARLEHVEAERPEGLRRAVVVGGGAAGVELAFALRRRLQAATGPADVTLVTSADLVPTLNDPARRRVAATLAARGIAVRTGCRASAVTAEGVRLDDGSTLPADIVLVSTRARAPAWLADTGLAVAADGSVLITPTLQTASDPRIFAVGDCAALVEDPTEKAGVYAVRQGPVLAKALARVATGQRPRAWRPQRQFLVLINTADGSAIASRGRRFSAQGLWVWRWKNNLDRRFMAMLDRFGRLGPARPDATGEIPAELRCGGCAAKVGPDALSQALARLPAPPAGAKALLRGLQQPDDAAVIDRGDGRVELETVDLVRAFIEDPYRFGEIAALHALSDIHAMGGRPVRALALASLPHGAPRIVAEDLFQLLAGVRAALDREGVTLAGGHSAEGADLGLGLAVTGEGEAARLTTKDAARPGDHLVLTKPLGTGIIFAAAMRGGAPATSIGAALASQRISNATAAAVLARHDVRAVTDVTGFGLLGHLAELMQASRCHAVVQASAVPILAGAGGLAKAGYVSSLLAQSLAAIRPRLTVEGASDLPDDVAAILLDPQTSGGLLAAVPAARATAVVADLRDAGFEASDIGTCTAALDGRTASILVRL